MRAICVDDEYLLLNNLIREVNAIESISEVTGFDDEEEALIWAKEHELDIAFLDVKMHYVGGISLAEQLRELYPDILIFFCTGYKEYGYEAMQLHADAYLLKPIRAEKIRAELNIVQNRKGVKANINKSSKLTVKCYGGFEVFDSKNQSLHFKRNLSKELFAYLIDKKGEMIPGDEICTVFWNETGVVKKDYLRKVFKELQRVLNEAGGEEILVKHVDLYGVDMGQIEFLKQDSEQSIYMQEYDWAKHN